MYLFNRSNQALNNRTPAKEVMVQTGNGSDELLFSFKHLKTLSNGIGL